MVAMFYAGLRQNEEFLKRTSQTSFLHSLGQIGPVVTEKIIKMWKVYR